MAGIYIHIPFCAKRCIYCDFYTQTSSSQKDNYIDAVCHELVLRKKYIKSESVNTIYFGGGTPSQLSEADFKKVFDAINENYVIATNAEITMEANPDDLNLPYLQMLRSLPINRLSIGIQSFEDRELGFLNRRHSATEAIEAVRNAQKAGFDNISIDLMYGLPNQTIDVWENNINQALELNIQHISAYHLIYEEGTKLSKLLDNASIVQVDEELSLSMFSLLIEKLNKGGFTHYEISNFAKEGFISRHNSSYWKGEKYLGIGASAHSFDGTFRGWNVSSIAKYIKGINSGTPILEIEESSLQSQYNDYILTRLRTIWGINLVELERLFGTKMLDFCLKNTSKYIEKKLITNKNGILKLTYEGIFISDQIMSDLMYIE